MPKFPEPPPIERLRAIGPLLRRLPTGTKLWRVYFREGQFPSAWNAFRAFGPLRAARFDHHLPLPRRQDRGILYAAARAGTCLAEVFQDTRLIDVGDRAPWLVCFETTSELLLLDLTGGWPTAAGASMAINSGPRPRAQRWSRAVYDAYPEVHGLWYASSMDANRPAVALYERAASALPRTPLLHRALADSTLRAAIRRVAASLGYGVSQ